MTCAACLEAEASPWLCGSYRALCGGCEARAMAHSPMAKDAALGFPQALQAACRKLWPTAEGYRVGRLAVWEWIKRIEEARAKA